MIERSHSEQACGRAIPRPDGRCPVDVVIPVYNGAPFIEKALRSVLDQELLPERIIVVDDGSTDDTAVIVRGVRGEVPICYLHKENGGLSSARNAGVRACTARYVAFLDADDEWCPNKLTEQLALFEGSGFPDLAAVYCRYDVIDENSNPVRECHIVEPDPGNRGAIFERLLAGNVITGSGSGILVKREALLAVGDFDETLSACEDWDMWLRLARQYRFDYVAEKLVSIRRHGANLQKDKVLMFENALAFYNKWSEAACRYGQHSAWGDTIAWRIACDLPDPGTFLVARRVLNKETKRRLFPCGSIVLGMLRNARSILILFAQRLLGRSTAA